MAKSQKSKPGWADVKAKLAEFDRPGLVGLIRDLYSADKRNQAFLHARFALDGDPLESYRKTIDRWLYPDRYRRQLPSVVKAKVAITDYRKAAGDPSGMAELMVYFCEAAAAFCEECGGQDASYYDAMVTMFGRALDQVGGVPESTRKALIERLEEVAHVGAGLGYGVGVDMDNLLAKHT